MLVLNCCTSTARKTNDRIELHWENVPAVFTPEGEPLIFEDVENNEVRMSREKWYEFVDYIVCTEENKKALDVYFNYE